MSRNRGLILAAVLVVFIAAGAFLVLRGTGAGGGAVSLDLRVTGSSMQPPDPSAHLNDSVTMTLTADRDEEIHLHGYDVAFDCQAGKPVSHTFKADKTGSFDIEIEASSQRVGTFTVSP